ncbi:hypothetical protein V5O48_019219, partial [Marasmius crinis-equi]
MPENKIRSIQEDSSVHSTTPGTGAYQPATSSWNTEANPRIAPSSEHSGTSSQSLAPITSNRVCKRKLSHEGLPLPLSHLLDPKPKPMSALEGSIASRPSKSWRAPDKTPGARQRMGREARNSDPSTRRRRRRREAPSLPSPNDDPRPPTSLYNASPNITEATGHGRHLPTSPSDYIQSAANYTPIERLPRSFLDVVASTQIYRPSTIGSQFPMQYEHTYPTMLPTKLPATQAYNQPLYDDEQDPGDNDMLSYGPSLSFTKKI